MKKGFRVLVVVTALASLAAKGGGCSVEAADDGTSDAWTTGEAPLPSRARPMSCEFLAEDNCWKRLSAKALLCAGDVTTDGTFAEDRRSCTTPSKGRLELGGAVNTPAPGNVSIVGTDWRILDGKGGVCATGKNVGLGRGIVDVGGEVVLFETISALEYRMTCPDGTTWSNESSVSGSPADAGSDPSDADAGSGDAGAATASVCPTFGLDWLAHRTPGILLSCDGTAKTCKLGLWGGSSGGEATLSTCHW